MPRPRMVFSSESESEDEVLRVHNRMRSHSRPRQHNPDLFQGQFLASPVSNGVHRSASTGARRHRNRQDPPAVIVDVHNEQLSPPPPPMVPTPRARSRFRHPLEFEDDFSEEFEEHRVRHHSRPRAKTHASRSPSPFHQRADWDMQMKLARMELEDESRHEKELIRRDERLRELQKEADRREMEARWERHWRKHHEEEEHERSAVERADKLSRLRKLEREEREAAERERIEAQQRIEKLEKIEREAAEREALQNRMRMEKMKEIEKKEAERAHEERIKNQLLLEQAKREALEAERKKKEAALKQQAIEEWQKAQAEKAAREKKAREEADRLFEERVKKEFASAGYSEEHIDIILKRKGGETTTKVTTEVDVARPTYIKVNRKYLAPETLDAHRLPWEWDERDGNFIIIKRWVSEEYQEELFEHTRRLRDRKLITATESERIELKINDNKKDKMFLVRKKSPKRSWIFT